MRNYLILIISGILASGLLLAQNALPPVPAPQSQAPTPGPAVPGAPPDAVQTQDQGNRPKTEEEIKEEERQALAAQFQNTEGYQYEPTGRRDPFKPFGESQSTKAPVTQAEPEEQVPKEPLEMYEVLQYKLVGIIWNVTDPKAMVRDPSGKLHMVKKETKIGRNNGFVAAIREGEVIVVEPTVAEGGLQSAVTHVLNLKR